MLVYQRVVQTANDFEKWRISADVRVFAYLCRAVSGLVLWLSLAETKYSKAPLGLDGPLAVRPHTREYCWCEMNAPMTAPLC